VIEKRIREEVFNQLPNTKDITARRPITLSIETEQFFTEENNIFKQALSEGNLLLLVTRYPIRETPALNKIAERAGFQGPSQYENAVRKLLLDDPDALSFVKSLFDLLIAQI
jgi:hypothetical protein